MSAVLGITVDPFRREDEGESIGGVEFVILVIIGFVVGGQQLFEYWGDGMIQSS